MPFIDTYKNFNIGNYRNRIFRRPIVFSQFVDSGDTAEDVGLSFTTSTGATLGKIFIDCQKPYLVSTKFTIEESGGRDFELILSELPPFPLENFTKITFSLGQTSVFTGYVYDSPDTGNTKRNPYSIKGFGMKKRLEEVTIQTDTNYNILTVTSSGTDRIYTFTTTIDLTKVQAGCKVIISGCDTDSNNGIYGIDSTTSNTITVTAASTTSQPTAAGLAEILPLEWSGATNLISDVFIHLIQNWGTYSNSVPISYDAGRITQTFGKLIGGAVNFNKMKFSKAMETLNLLLGGDYYIGVDGEGYYFLNSKPTDILKTFFVGFDLNDFELKQDYDKIKNIITVYRARNKFEGGAGSKIGAIGLPLADSQTSIAKYGRKEDSIEVPGYFSDAACQLIADKALELNKDPRYQWKANNLILKNYQFGTYRVVSAEDLQKEIIMEFESLTDWTYTVGLDISLESDLIISGAKSFQLFVNNTDENSYFEYSYTTPIDFIQKNYLALYVRSTYIGEVLRLELTDDDGVTVETYSIVIDGVNQFLRISIDISNSNIINLKKIKFIIKNIPIDSNNYIYIDELSFYYFGVKLIESNLKLATYNISNDKKYVNLDFGRESDKLENFLAGLRNAKNNNNLYLDTT
jgi:hypothetical protein